MGMNKENKKTEEDIQKSEENLNGLDQESEVSSEPDSEDENLGTPSYEELLDKNEEIKNSLLRLNADLDNAYKRTLSEVEKAHKYGTERLLTELLPVIDNLESALSNLSENSTKEDKEGIELTLKSFESTLDKFLLLLSLLMTSFWIFSNSS